MPSILKVFAGVICSGFFGFIRHDGVSRLLERDEKRRLRPALAGDDPEAVVLDFMQPFTAGGKLIGFAWQARRDEPGRCGDMPT
jgi:hypothetical protein